MLFAYGKTKAQIRDIVTADQRLEMISLSLNSWAILIGDPDE